MKRSSVVALGLSLLSAGLVRAQSSQPVPPREQVGFTSLDDASLRADLTYISSDKLLGRMSLQPGDDEAARWVANQFAKAGLKPAATDGAGKPGFLQPFTLVEFRPDRAESSVT